MAPDEPLASEPKSGRVCQRGISLCNTIILQGDAPREGGKPRVPVGGGKVTIPDHQTQSGLYVEAKFGPSASLTKNQTTAFSMDPDGFRLDHFLPQDVGAAAAAMASNSVMTAPRPVAKREGSSTKTKRKGS